MTNEDWLDEWRDHEWWPAIIEAHKSLTELYPNYQITQIKSKFGGLRYYFDANTDDNDLQRWESANLAVDMAESWVEGYENARKEFKR